VVFIVMNCRAHPRRRIQDGRDQRPIMSADMGCQNQRSRLVLQQVLARSADIVKHRVIGVDEDEKQMPDPFAQRGVNETFHCLRPLQIGFGMGTLSQRYLSTLLNTVHGKHHRPALQRFLHTFGQRSGYPYLTLKAHTPLTSPRRRAIYSG
jgi:hypothetical protein